MLFGTQLVQVIFKPGYVGIRLRQSPLEALIETGVATHAAAYCVGPHACRFGIVLDALEYEMQFVHAASCAKKHTSDQVLIATLNETDPAALLRRMNGSFRDALIWHLETTQTRVADLTRATGVSRDVINKLLSGASRSTAAENAILIAAYFGKSLEQFIRRDDTEPHQSLAALTELLTPDEERLLAAQVRGILGQRGSR